MEKRPAQCSLEKLLLINQKKDEAAGREAARRKEGQAMKFGFIGIGNMGKAIIKGYLSQYPQRAAEIFACDRDPDRAAEVCDALGIHCCESISQLVKQSDVIILAVKPNNFAEVLPKIDEVLTEKQVLLSIAAGISMAYVEDQLTCQTAKVVRVMPNTPAMVGEGMTALCHNGRLTEQEFAEIMALFTAIGKVEVVEESLIHTVIGVSGSSPAYVYLFIEALIAEAVAGGMTREQATKFAGQSVLGAAKMVLETGVDPVTLRENVCSPGGTTIEAVQVLQENEFAAIVRKAACAAAEKSKKMTQ